ncbi:Riboflavin transporter FmnP [Listeria floridensis FSL S10-1187]|uniref:Riboflavin transporter n=1 Tax=Listeria floridensis FSL S10-1187 TaxID=1265817 RepID=A0ABN0RGC4_9LIST|nr:ECF transporter S component [Listeria floridensis]EUJ32917.1 Riboflavin transporter FmnP [Listeria floridensis FSL S10-1187]
MKSYSLKAFVSIAVFGTVAFIIMLLQFPLLPSAPFLKLDFSDIPALIGGLMFGPLAIILIELIKNILEFIVSGSPVGIPVGEITNFLSGLCYTLPIYYLFRFVRGTKGFLASAALGTLLMTIAMSLFNYFILLPFYVKLGGLPAETDILALVTAAIIPFNLLKGVVVSAGFMLLYAPMKNFIAKNRSKKEQAKYEKKAP